MKNSKIGFTSWVWCMIVFLIICVLFSLCFAKQMHANVASIIGGTLSAFATIFVGLVAIWQNNRFKKITDEANDIQIRPEFFVTYFPTHEDEYYDLPSLTITPLRMQRQKEEPQEELLCCCKVLNFPVVRLRPRRLFYSIENQTTDYYGEFVEQTNPNLILEKDQVFRVFISKYVTLCDIYLEIEYENIYGDVYVKAIEFVAPAKNEISKATEATIFGTFASGTIKMKPAVKQMT